MELQNLTDEQIIRELVEHLECSIEYNFHGKPIDECIDAAALVEEAKRRGLAS